MIAMLHSIQAWFTATPIAPFIRDVVWVKAVLESVHILADGLVLFSAGLMCARLVAGPTPREPAAEAARRLAPWIWGAVAVAVGTGLILLTGAGRRGLDNPMFQIKLATLLGAVGLTAGVQLSAAHSRARLPGRRAATALAAALGFLLWLATVFAGRLLAYSSAFFEPQS